MSPNQTDFPGTASSKDSGRKRNTRRPRRRRGEQKTKAGITQLSPSVLAARAAALPVITYPDLPVTERRADIASAIRDNQVVIVAGETGSGKTTQIPKICLEQGRGIAGMIGHTQPRRLAARAVAERIAHELGQEVSKEVGDIVGYQVRFTDEVGPTTLVKLMTDGILLAEMSLDPLLSRYDTIIVDEAHERSLNIDFILGYLGRLLPKRPDLKVIITSATIDSQRFAEHFSKQTGKPVPVIEVSGRTYPVELRYRPLSADLDGDIEGDDFSSLGYGLGEDLDLETALLGAVDELLTEPQGDILVFLPGERDILEATQALQEHLGDRFVSAGAKPLKPGSVEVVPLFARLSAAEQHRIYQPHTTQRIILSTNIAETSLTVPGIKYVIDAGLARISRFSNKTKVQRLPIEAVSRASAAQRSGRAGRTSAGVAIRLYSQRDHDARPEFTEPEILRTSLASVILQMSDLGLGEVKDFPFLDPPAPRAVRDGVQLLMEIGALNEDGVITRLGRQLARLPIDPRLGRMLVAASRSSCASEVLVIVAALSIQDPRERPAEAQEQSDQAHRRYADPSSDFLTYLNLWRYLNVQARDLSGSGFRRLCRREYLHYLRYREWRDITTQLRQMCRQVGIKVEPIGLPSRTMVSSFQGEQEPAVHAVLEFARSAKSVAPDEIHRAVLSGLLSNIGSWDESRKDYAGVRGTHFTVWPGSALRKRRPDWVMAAELVETSRLFARTVAGIKPEWVEEYAKNLVKHSYSDPVWSRARGSAIVSEKVTLYGLTLIADRMVPLASLGETTIGKGWGNLESVPQELTARSLARELFIQNALVKGDWRDNHWDFAKHNREVMAEAEELSERLRDPALVPGEAVRYQFFETRVPKQVSSAAAFGKWWKDSRGKTPHFLDYSLEDLLPAGARLDTSLFPSEWKQGDLAFPLAYTFDPSSTEDGVTVTIPLSVLGRVENKGFDWLVPGLLEELCVGMIRALPKQKRRFLAPATQTGAELAVELQRLRDGAGTPPLGGQETSTPNTPGLEEEEVNPYSLEASISRLQDWGASSGAVRRSGRNPESRKGSTPGFNPPVQVKPVEPKAPGQADKPEGSSEQGPPTAIRMAGKLSFDQEFARAVRNRSGVDLSAEDLRLARKNLPNHLRTGFRVQDERGVILAADDSLPRLQRRLSKASGKALQSSVREALEEAKRRVGQAQTPGKPGSKVTASLTEPSSFEGVELPPERGSGEVRTADSHPGVGSSSGNRTSDQRAHAPAPTGSIPPSSLAGTEVAELPEQALPRVVEAEDSSGFTLRGYPTLAATSVTAGSPITIELRSTQDEAVRDFETGLAALLLRDLALESGRITSRWSGNQALLLAGSPYPNTEALVADAQAASVLALLRRSGVQPESVRDREAYGNLRDRLRDQFEDEVHATLLRVVQDVKAFARLQEALAAHPQETYKKVRGAAKAHAESLFRAGYLTKTDPLQSAHLSRYLLADAARVERSAKGPAELGRDAHAEQELREVEFSLGEVQARLASRPYSRVHSGELAYLRYLAEELRVSLFAQQLGTSARVSAPRILRRIETLERQ